MGEEGCLEKTVSDLYWFLTSNDNAPQNCVLNTLLYI